jgi:SpoVK/Ycf46/Vps4 family AAA+-type ATPase
MEGMTHRMPSGSVAEWHQRQSKHKGQGTACFSVAHFCCLAGRLLTQAGNAVLTQLDRLKRYPNVLVLCTSNLTEMIDEAFTDRFVNIPHTRAPPQAGLGAAKAT